MAKTARIGLPGYVRILAALRDKPMSHVEAQDGLKLRHNTAHRLLNGMYALGLLRIAGWLVEPDRPTAPRFGLGPGADEPAPLLRPDGRPVTRAKMPLKVRPGSELVAFKSLLQGLESPATALELADATGLSIVTVRRTLAAMTEHRLAHIALWTPRPGCAGGPPQPNYQAGAGNNARRPIPLTNAERNRALVARQAQRRNNQPLVELSLMWLQPAAPSATHGEAA